MLIIYRFRNPLNITVNMGKDKDKVIKGRGKREFAKPVGLGVVGGGV